MINIIIPIADKGTSDENSEYMRGLYEIERKTVLQYVFDSLKDIPDAKYFAVLKKEYAESFHIDDMLKLFVPDINVVIAEGDTCGAACSCLLAIDEINEDEPLIITGSNQIITVNVKDAVDDFVKKEYDGGIITFEGVHPKWSFVRLDDNNMVVEAAEKRPISNEATTGFYYFKRAGDFVEAACSMIEKKASVNEKYYICPSYNEMILKGKKVGIYHIDKENYFNLRDSKGLNEFEEYMKSNRS